jgi:Tannase and feruloyl esterase
LQLLQEDILRQCDTLDGVKDRIINDPSKCKFDFSVIPVCQDTAGNANCFTPQQLTAVKTVYEALTNKEDTIYPGYPYGAENEPGGWDTWIAGNNPNMHLASLHYLFATNMFKFLVFNNPEWDYSKYDFSAFFKETRYAKNWDLQIP